jgi:acyl carrier protein
MEIKILNKIKFIIAKQFQIKNNIRIFNLELFIKNFNDSLDFLEFIIYLEKSFKVKISDSFNIKNKTIKEIITKIAYDKNGI